MSKQFLQIIILVPYFDVNRCSLFIYLLKPISRAGPCGVFVIAVADKDIVYGFYFFSTHMVVILH